MHIFGTPEILSVDKSGLFLRNIFCDFCAGRKFALKAEILGHHHQWQGATESSHAHFRGLTELIIWGMNLTKIATAR